MRMMEPTGSAPVEERTKIPRAHAQALLEVCGGQITIERSTLAIRGSRGAGRRITHPGVLTSVAVEFHNPDEAEAFNASGVVRARNHGESARRLASQEPRPTGCTRDGSRRFRSSGSGRCTTTALVRAP